MSKTELTPEQITWEYCSGEMWSGYPCGTVGCPYCGGPEGVEATRSMVADYVGRNRRKKTDAIRN